MSSTIRLADLVLEHPGIAKKITHPKHSSIAKTESLKDKVFSPMEAYSSVAASKVSKPLSELALYKKAQLLSREGRYREGIDDFRRLIRTFPNGRLVEHSRAAALESLNRELEMLLAEDRNLELIGRFHTHRDLMSGTDLKPYELFCRAGEAYIKVGMPLRATEVLRRVVSSEFKTPCYEQASWLIGRALLEAREFSQAAKRLGAFLAHYPEGPYSRQARFGLAKALFLDKRYADAIGQLEKETSREEHAPFSFEALWMLARVQKATAKPAQALQTYKKLMSLEPQGGREQVRWVRLAAFEAADLLFDSDSFPEALQAYQEALDRYPRDPSRPRVQLQIGRVLQFLGRHREAKVAYETLVKDDGDSLWGQVAAEYLRAIERREQWQAVLTK